LKIEQEPTPFDQDAVAAKQLQLAEFSLYRGDTTIAQGFADQLLAREPENIGGLRLQAKLLMREGKTLDAVNALEEALQVYAKKFPNADPPLGLLHERSAVTKDLAPKVLKENGPAIQ
jgi:Tfp pilus assembly protein PilF